MDAKRWRKKIKQSAEESGTYRPFFDPVIKTLAEILEDRDRAREEWLVAGGSSVIETDKGMTKNPRMTAYNDLNTTALAYWRDLGLTPKGLKAIDEQAMKPKKKSALAEILKDL